MVKYKDFYTRIKFSKEDNMFFGKIENSKDLVTFHGDTPKECVESFKSAADDYLEMCKSVGKNPDIKTLAEMLS